MAKYKHLYCAPVFLYPQKRQVKLKILLHHSLSYKRNIAFNGFGRAVHKGNVNVENINANLHVVALMGAVPNLHLYLRQRNHTLPAPNDYGYDIRRWQYFRPLS